MRSFLLAAGLIIGVAISISLSWPQARPADQQAQEEKGASPTTDRRNDEAAIRENVAAFVKAYNAKDSKAIGALFAPDGQLAAKDGSTTEGP